MGEKTGRTDVQDFSEISWLNYGRIFMKTEMEMKVLALKISKGYVEKLVIDRDEKRPAEECEHKRFTQLHLEHSKLTMAYP